MKCRVDQQRANAEQQQPPVACQRDAYRPRRNLSESMVDHPHWGYELSEHCRSKCSCDNEDGLNVGRDQLSSPNSSPRLTTQTERQVSVKWNGDCAPCLIWSRCQPAE